MSVRRLAKTQPDNFAFNKDSESEIKFWLAKYPDEKKASGAIPLLWIAQKQEGWVCEPALRVIAERLEMPYIRIYEVVTFYTMFNLAPVGENLLSVCGTSPCMLRGSEGLMKVCKNRIGEQGEISKDGKFSWVEVECMGACANAPMLQVANKDGDHYVEDLDEAKFETFMDNLAAGKNVEYGPQSERTASEPHGSTVLTDPSLFDGSKAKKIKLPNAAPKKKAKAAPKAKAEVKPKATAKKPAAKKTPAKKPAARKAVPKKTGDKS